MAKRRLGLLGFRATPCEYMLNIACGYPTECGNCFQVQSQGVTKTTFKPWDLKGAWLVTPPNKPDGWLALSGENTCELDC